LGTQTAAQAAVAVWDAGTGALLAELTEHHHGVVAVACGARARGVVVSVGTVHDGCIIVWDWRTGTRLAVNKLTSKVEHCTRRAQADQGRGVC
jgi:WD40 repeat protein